AGAVVLSARLRARGGVGAPRRFSAGASARQGGERHGGGRGVGAALLGSDHPVPRLPRAAQLASRHGRRERSWNSRVPTPHRAAHGGPRPHSPRCHHPGGAVGGPRHPEPGVRAGPAREGPGLAASVHPRGQELRSADPHRARAPVRLPAGRLRPRGVRLLVAGDGLPVEPRHLPAGHSGVAGRDPRARDLLRAAQPRRRPAADAGRSAHRSPLMAISTTLLQAEMTAATPMSYWRTVGWRLARDPTTLVAGGRLALIVLLAGLAPWLLPHAHGGG